MKTLLWNLFVAIAILLATGLSTYAQVSVNTDGSDPDNSAMLDVKSANKGVLIPRIALTGTLDATTIASPAISLLIYNTATAGTSPNNVAPGYYYWSGTAWTRLSVFTGGSGTTNYVPKWASTSALGNSLLFDNGSNVGIGTATPGAKLDVAGRIWQTNTGQSVFLGEGAGASDDLYYGRNVFVGYQAGWSNTTGSNNTAIGFRSLYFNKSEYGNTAIGQWSLANHTTGTYNTATGYDALISDTSGYNNTAHGAFALGNNTSGYDNTAYGKNALGSNITGTDNTAIGFFADVASDTLVNATAIGAYAQAGSDNSLVLGGISGINGATASVNVGIGTTTPSAKLDVIGAVKITDGTQGANKVLTSDANGLAVWQAPAAPPAAWLLAGNAGTVAGTNFIGTTDNISFDIRTSNLLKTRITTKGAIETYNTGHSVFLGESAGAVDDLSDNRNVFIGYQSGHLNTSGNWNTAGGYQSLYTNTTGYNNTAIGYSSLYLNSTGYYNTATGIKALYTNNAGSYNIADGENALYSNTTGIANTAIGFNALYTNTNGSYNIGIGFQADVASNSLGNAIAIGSNAIVSASNQVRLGDGNITTLYCMGAYAGTVGTTNRDLYADNTGKIGYIASSARYKDNIADMENVNWLYKLRPVNFIYKTDDSHLKQYGLIAEEVEKVKPEFVSYNSEGRPETVSYSSMISPLIKALQEQNVMIESQQKQIDELKLMVRELISRK